MKYLFFILLISISSGCDGSKKVDAAKIGISSLGFSINDSIIDENISELRLYEILGQPSRIVKPTRMERDSIFDALNVDIESVELFENSSLNLKYKLILCLFFIIY